MTESVKVTKDTWSLTGAEPSCGVPEQDEARQRVWANHNHYSKGWVTIAPLENGFQGVIEHSFSMDASKDRVRFWRERKDNYEGFNAAEEYRQHFNKTREGEPFVVWDIDDPNCPIYLDFVSYEADCKAFGQPSKFHSRNLRFHIKD